MQVDDAIAARFNNCSMSPKDWMIPGEPFDSDVNERLRSYIAQRCPGYFCMAGNEDAVPFELRSVFKTECPQREGIPYGSPNRWRPSATAAAESDKNMQLYIMLGLGGLACVMLLLLAINM